MPSRHAHMRSDQQRAIPVALLSFQCRWSSERRSFFGCCSTSTSSLELHWYNQQRCSNVIRHGPYRDSTTTLPQQQEQQHDELTLVVLARSSSNIRWSPSITYLTLPLPSPLYTPPAQTPSRTFIHLKVALDSQLFETLSMGTHPIS